jgi:hypothetical protein
MEIKKIKLKKVYLENIILAYRYFRNLRQDSFCENECVNILFLQNIAKLNLIERPWCPKDYRIRFILSIKHDLMFDPHGECAKNIVQLCKRQKYKHATTEIVTYGLQLWLQTDLNQIASFCKFVSNLPALNEIIEVTFTSQGKCSAKIEQYLYFLTHYLLVLFRYARNIMSRLWIPWQILLTSHRIELHTELILEIFWVSLLSKKYLVGLVLPKHYYTFLQSETLKLLFTPFNDQMPDKKSHQFIFFHRLYHQSILAIILLNLISACNKQTLKVQTRYLLCHC